MLTHARAHAWSSSRMVKPDNISTCSRQSRTRTCGESEDLPLDCADPVRHSPYIWAALLTTAHRFPHRSSSACMQSDSHRTTHPYESSWHNRSCAQHLGECAHRNLMQGMDHDASQTASSTGLHLPLCSEQLLRCSGQLALKLLACMVPSPIFLRAV